MGFAFERGRGPQSVNAGEPFSGGKRCAGFQTDGDLQGTRCPRQPRIKPRERSQQPDSPQPKEPSADGLVNSAGCVHEIQCDRATQRSGSPRATSANTTPSEGSRAQKGLVPQPL